ncbi:Fc.00g066650.m01.CDS01 [Cosmosporella sp. VM-42]
MANITIRNVTVSPLELISIERFEGERVSTGNVLSNVSGKITGFLNATEISSHQTVAKGNAVHKEDVSVRVEPFKTKKTDIHAPDAQKEVFRLIFKADGDHRYEVDIPSPSRKSSVMKKLNGGDHDYTVVYTPNGSFLAIFSSARLNAWMKELHNDWPLPLLSIPGTHNSPTCHTALPSVRCQAVGVPEQLRNGVRFLDIRVSVNSDNDELALVHSAFPISLTGTKYFKDMLTDIYKFLDENPSETVLMSVKREGTGKGNDGQLGKYLKYSYVDKKREKWWTEPKLPTLGGARGRIVIIRRFALADDMHKACWDGRGWGLDAQSWPDNCEDGKVGSGIIRVQDFYEITESQNIEKKIEFTRGQLERAAEQNWLLGKGEAPTTPFFVNFLSASNFFNATCWPERIAAKLNPSVIEYLCMRHGEEGKGPKKLKVGSASTGIVVTDWVGANDDWDLIRCIVGMNAKLQLRN